MPTRTLLPLVFPEGLLLLCAIALVHSSAAAPAMSPVLHLYPLVVLIGGALLGWRFRRGRLLLALLGLVTADAAMRWLTPAESNLTHAGPAIVSMVAMLVPVGFAVLAFVGESGVLTATGLRRLAALTGCAAAVCAVWFLSAMEPERVDRAFGLALVPVTLPAWLPIGQPASLVALMAVLVLAGRTLWRSDPESRGFLWAAIAVVVAACVGPAHGMATIHLANAGLVLVVATIESAYAMAYHDELTGLPARRALNDALLRVEGMYTVAMVDVDHFKTFNDTHGHDVGDQVLRMVAARLARVPGGGRAFRYGGEEFTVLFPGKSAQESAPYLEMLRASVANATFTERGRDRPRRKPASPRAHNPRNRQLAVTVSIGAAQPRSASLAMDVVKAADKALYRAKEGGRNRVAM